MSMYDNLIFVDCEAEGPCPALGRLTEFGAVGFRTEEFFHGKIWESYPDPENPAKPICTGRLLNEPYNVFARFEIWLKMQYNGRPTFVSDNPAYDWQWINDGFHVNLGHNPFGYSARRIGDFYAGLAEDYSKSNAWKKLRVTKHDHNPVNDARGNLEAFKRMLAGDRVK